MRQRPRCNGFDSVIVLSSRSGLRAGEAEAHGKAGAIHRIAAYCHTNRSNVEGDA
jgi:hypothetical protein